MKTKLIVSALCIAFLGNEAVYGSPLQCPPSPADATKIPGGWALRGTLQPNTNYFPYDAWIFDAVQGANPAGTFLCHYANSAGDKVGLVNQNPTILHPKYVFVGGDSSNDRRVACSDNSACTIDYQTRAPLGLHCMATPGSDPLFPSGCGIVVKPPQQKK